MMTKDSEMERALETKNPAIQLRARGLRKDRNMSMRTVCEFNHDYVHRIKENPEEFFRLLTWALSGGRKQEKEELMRFGLTMAETAHHSDVRQYRRNGKIVYEF